jgi:hypothetical protein
MSVSVYVHPGVEHTIFQNERTRDVLISFGVEFVDAPEHANILLGNQEGLIRELIDAFGASKRYLLWTHEPGFWISTQKWATIAGQQVRTISLHSGEIFFDNYYYACINLRQFNRPTTERTQLNRTVVMVASAKKPRSAWQAGLANGIELLTLRYNLALAGYVKGQLDIYGMYWPEGLSRGQSRYGHWSRSKYKILERYDFNLCFENCLVPYYCSEKIWQAIHCGCLPIYYGQDCIYEDFPPDSFLDYATLGSADALFDAVNRMSLREFRERYERCLRVFQRAYPLGRSSRDQAARYAALQMIALDPGTASVPCDASTELSAI